MSKLTQIHCYYKYELSQYSNMEDVQISLNLCLIPTSSAARGDHRNLLVVRRKPEKSIEPKSSWKVPQHPNPGNLSHSSTGGVLVTRFTSLLRLR